MALRSSAFDVLLSPGCRLVLQEYDIYVAAIVDGDSRMCCALTALTNKLPITIYLFVMLGFLHEFGYPNQLVTDRGNEFRLCAFACMAVHLHAWRYSRSPAMASAACVAPKATHIFAKKQSLKSRKRAG